MNPQHPSSVARRDFLAGSLALGVTAGLGAVSRAAEPVTRPATAPAGVIDSPPVVQCASATGFSVAWAVKRAAMGYVEWGPTPELGRRAVGSAYGLAGYSERFLSARVEGVEPGQTVFYRVVSVPITYKSAYKIERGEPETGATYKLQLPNPASARASVTVINDTHEKKETLTALFGLAQKSPSDALVWNGDVFNDIRTDQQIVEQVLRPAGLEYATQAPVYFTSGNHDVRGAGARGLGQAVLPWASEEPLGRCFAVRNGPIAMIGLDTGEDKPDAHPVFAGLANFEPYRAAQAQWLRKALARPEIDGAPFIVAFCHIPLWGLPGDNPGDTLDGYASYSRFGQRLWGTILEEARISLLVNGHTHSTRWDAPAPGHSYPQLVGGGPKLADARIIRLEATVRKMEISMQKADGSAAGQWEVPPRRG